MGRLYVVATPIGNLEDLTARARAVLSAVPCVACEDTRRTGRLLAPLGVRPRLVSCHGHNAERCVPAILDVLEGGRDVAYVSDAGTPGVSDPGARLVAAARAAAHEVIPVPGPSAVTALLSISGLSSKAWFFEGFLSNKAGRRSRRLAELIQRGDPFVLYESPHRVVKLILALEEIDENAEILIGREMTKVHEQYLHGTAADLSRRFGSGQVTEKGEFTLLVHPSKRG